MVNGDKAFLNPVKFNDEGTKFYFKYYYDQLLNVVESRYVELQNVYGM